VLRPTFAVSSTLVNVNHRSISGTRSPFPQHQTVPGRSRIRLHIPSVALQRHSAAYARVRSGTSHKEASSLIEGRHRGLLARPHRSFCSWPQASPMRSSTRQGLLSAASSPNRSPRRGGQRRAPRVAGRPVSSGKSGYIQAVYAHGLLKLMVGHDLRMKMERRIGQFVSEGACWPP
jgi:hypothetical protein